MVRKLPVFVIGISAAGRVCWETPLTQPQANSHTSSPPLISDGAAYLDSDTVVFAVDLATGSRQWRWNSGSMQGTAGYGGGNATVTVADGRVVATKGDNTHQALVGLNQANGAVTWTSPEPQRASPVPTDDGGIALSGESGAVSSVINDTDGRTRWQRPAPAPPSAGGGLIEVYAGVRPVDGDLVESIDGNGVQAVRSSDGGFAWTYPGDVNEIEAVGSLLILTPRPDQNGQYDVDSTAVDPTTGHPLWMLGPLDPGGSTFFGAGGDLLHAQTGQQGSYSRVDPTTGRSIWQAPTEVYTATAAAGNLIDLETSGNQTGNEAVVARNPATGAVVWRTPAPSTNSGIDDATTVRLFALTGDAGATVAEVHGASISGFDPADGRRLWGVSLPTNTVIDGEADAGSGLVVQASDEAYAIQGH